MKFCFFIYLVIASTSTKTLQLEENEPASYEVEQVDMLINSINKLLNPSAQKSQMQMQRKLTVGYTPEEQAVMNAKIIKELSQVKELIETEFNYDPNVTKCLTIRSIMRFLPGFKPVETGLWSALKSNAGKMPKSFRTLGLNLVHKLDLLDNNINPLPDDHILKNLRNLKVEYYETYMKNNNQFRRIEGGEELESKREVLLELKNKLIKYEKSKANLVKEENKIETKILKSIKTISDNKTIILDTLVKERRHLIDEIKKIYLIDEFSDIDSLKKEFIIKHNISNAVLSLKFKLYVLDATTIRTNALLYIQKKYLKLDLTKGTETNKDYYEIKKVIEHNLHEKRGKTESIFDIKKKLVKAYQERIDEIEDILEDMDGMEDYTEQFDKLFKLRVKQRKEKENGLELKKEIDDLESFVRQRGGDTNYRHDYLIPDDYLAKITKEYKNFYNILKEMNLSPEKEQSKDARIIAEFKELDNFGDNTLLWSDNYIFSESAEFLFEKDADLRKEVEHYPYFNKSTTLDDQYINSIKEAKEMFTKYSSQLIDSFNDLRTNLEMAKNIQRYEGEIDNSLGHHFAQIYRLNKNLKCFADTTLSYYLFNMIKTNIIFDEIRFFTIFLGEINTTDAYNFMIVNYSFFSEPIYVIDLTSRIKDLDADEYNNQLRDYINNFASNYSLTINSFKDLTDYSENLHMKSSQFFSILMERIKLIAMKEVLFWIRFYKDQQIRKLVLMIIEKIMNLLVGSIIFLSMVPFLQKIIAKILSRLIYAIIDYIIKRLGLSLEEVITKIKSIKFKKNKAIHAGFIETIDFEELIKKHISTEFIEGEEDEEVQFQQRGETIDLEQKFFDAANDPYSVYNQTEKFSLMRLQKDESLKLAKLMIESMDITPDEKGRIERKLEIFDKTSHVKVPKLSASKMRVKFMKSRQRDHLIRRSLIVL